MTSNPPGPGSYDGAMSFCSPVTLTGDLVTLEPLAPEHLEGLVAAATDGRLWELSYTSVPAPDAMAAEIDRRLHLAEEGLMVPFTSRLTDGGRITGMTTYMNVEAEHRRVEIGSTWTAASAQRTGHNTEAKLLLLTHAFETLDTIAVEFRTHWLNRQSRAAIERLGARLDGILRSHQIAPDGSLRDTAVYSIVASEWPAVRAELRRRLAASAGRPDPEVVELSAVDAPGRVS